MLRFAICECLYQRSIAFQCNRIPEGSLPSKPGILLDGEIRASRHSSLHQPFCNIDTQETSGDNADEFMPDRWLRASEEEFRLWRTFDARWGFGVRKCPGRHIGIMVLYKALVLVGHHSSSIRSGDLSIRVTAPVWLSTGE